MEKLKLNKTAVFTTVFVLALAVRLFFVFQWDQTPYGAWPVLDAQVYDSWGKTIAEGHLLRAKAFYASPLFPYLVGLLYWVFGHDLLVVGIFNTLCGAFTTLILASLTATMFGLEASLCAGLLSAFYMPLIFYTAPIMKEPLALLLLVAFTLYAFRLLKENRRSDYLVAGALLALCAMVRGNILFLVPALLGFAFLRWRKASLRNATCFLAVFGVCIFPATLHNYIVSDDFVPINYAYGFNLYIGNSPSANGTNQYPPEVSSDPVQEEFAAAYAARQALGHDPKPSEISKYWRDRALAFIFQNPVRDVELAANKTIAFWNNTEAFDNYDIGFIQKNFETVLSLPLVGFWLVAGLAALGAALVWRAKRLEAQMLLLFIAAYMASVVMFYVTDRYRLPVVIFLFPFAGAAVPYAWRSYEKKSYGRLAGGVSACLFMIGFSLLPFPGAVDLTGFDWGTLSTIYAETGQDDETIASLHKAMAIRGADVGAQAYIDGAFIEHRRGNDAGAEAYFKEALKSYPGNGILMYNYGRFKAAQGDIPNALVAMKKAVALAPSFALNYYGLAMLYQRLGQRDKAVEATADGLSVDPADENLRKIDAELDHP